MAPRVAYWFRTDLRLHDQPALAEALKLKPECLYPVWTWDPHYVYHHRVAPNRWRFLLDCQSDLDSSIREKTGGHNGLLVLRGNPMTCLENVLRDWNITHLVFERDTDTYGAKRDRKVTDMAESLGVKVVSVLGRTLWDPEAMLRQNDGKAIYSISAVQKCGPKIGEVPRPTPTPESLPKAGELKLDIENDDQIDNRPDVNVIDRKSRQTEKVSCYEQIAGPNGDFAVVKMEELDMSEPTSIHRGGEKLALKQLKDYCADAKQTAEFEKPKTNPGAFNPPETTLLSPHLHFGSLGIRQFYWAVKDVLAKYKGTASKPPASLEGQLLFRDMYFHAQHATQHYERVAGNPHCRYMAWKLPNTYDGAGNVTGYDKSAATNGDDRFGPGRVSAEEQYVRWATGKTGFPWIDAIMRQLIRGGWIHHLARHAVACFLTRGHLYISWERGAEVFERHLLDHEPACNAGNWQWLSCSAFFTSYYRVYSPVAFGRKWDPSGKLIREFCPELATVPDKFIYEPWKMTSAEQSKYGVTIGKDYPGPMVDVQAAAKNCLEAMKSAYAAKIMGDHPDVASGKARQQLDGYLPDTGDVDDPGAFDWHAAEHDVVVDLDEHAANAGGSGSGGGSEVKKEPATPERKTSAKGKNTGTGGRGKDNFFDKISSPGKDKKRSAEAHAAADDDGDGAAEEPASKKSKSKPKPEEEDADGQAGEDADAEAKATHARQSKRNKK